MKGERDGEVWTWRKAPEQEGSSVCVSKARVRRQRTKGGGQWPKEVRGPG